MAWPAADAASGGRGVNAPLPLKDLHPGVAPGWWPPAPGWWLIAAAVLLLACGIGIWFWRRRRRRARLLAVFDAALADAVTPPGKVAAASELLRRAARRHYPDADRLQGEDWLRVLDDGGRPPRFSTGHGRLILDGAYRRELDPAAVDALCALARARYADWVGRP